MTRAIYGSEFDAPSSESTLVHLLLDTVPPWSLPEHSDIPDAYFRDIGRTNSLNVPSAFEVGMIPEDAERYRANGNMAAARELSLQAHSKTARELQVCTNLWKNSTLQVLFSGVIWFSH